MWLEMLVDKGLLLFIAGEWEPPMDAERRRLKRIKREWGQESSPFLSDSRHHAARNGGLLIVVVMVLLLFVKWL